MTLDFSRLLAARKVVLECVFATRASDQSELTFDFYGSSPIVAGTLDIAVSRVGLPKSRLSIP